MESFRMILCPSRSSPSTVIAVAAIAPPAAPAGASPDAELADADADAPVVLGASSHGVVGGGCVGGGDAVVLVIWPGWLC